MIVYLLGLLPSPDGGIQLPGSSSAPSCDASPSPCGVSSGALAADFAAIAAAFAATDRGPPRGCLSCDVGSALFLAADFLPEGFLPAGLFFTGVAAAFAVIAFFAMRSLAGPCVAAVAGLSASSTGSTNLNDDESDATFKRLRSLPVMRGGGDGGASARTKRLWSLVGW